MVEIICWVPYIVLLDVILLATINTEYCLIENKI